MALALGFFLLFGVMVSSSLNEIVDTLNEIAWRYEVRGP
jgi:hypothetical protein